MAPIIAEPGVNQEFLFAVEPRPVLRTVELVLKESSACFTLSLRALFAEGQVYRRKSWSSFRSTSLSTSAAEFLFHYPLRLIKRQSGEETFKRGNFFALCPNRLLP
jgi:hypothetical protein